MSNQETEIQCGGAFSIVTTPSAGTHRTTTVEQCSSCGSTKRRSLFSSSSLSHQPLLKKPTPSPPSAAAQPPPSAAGFTKIQLPATLLRRTASQPIYPISYSSPPLTTESLPAHFSDSPENMKMVKSPAKMVPPPPTFNLRRTISDPYPALLFPCSPGNDANISSPATETPETLRQVVGRESGEMGVDSLITGGETPNSMDMKKVKEMLRVMSDWFNEAVQQLVEQEEEEEADGVGQEDFQEKQESAPFSHDHDYQKEQDEEGDGCDGQMCEEAVSVSKTGECINVAFKCPCGKGYQIILSGEACYYKLI